MAPESPAEPVHECGEPRRVCGEPRGARWNWTSDARPGRKNPEGRLSEGDDRVRVNVCRRKSIWSVSRETTPLVQTREAIAQRREVDD